MSKQIKRLLTLFAIPMALVVIVTIGTGLFSFKGYGFSDVSPTGSMFPTIQTGDKVIINWNVDSFINRNLTGEIIVFGKQNICHRVIWDHGEWLHTRGDAFTDGGEYLTRDEIKGIFIQVSKSPIAETIQYGWSG